MTHQNARFYFANLVADVVRCVSSGSEGNEVRYTDSLKRARRTLGFLRTVDRPEAYEEGILLVRALTLAHADGVLHRFGQQIERVSREHPFRTL